MDFRFSATHFIALFIVGLVSTSVAKAAPDSSCQAPTALRDSVARVGDLRRAFSCATEQHPFACAALKFTKDQTNDLLSSELLARTAAGSRSYEYRAIMSRSFLGSLKAMGKENKTYEPMAEALFNRLKQRWTLQPKDQPAYFRELHSKMVAVEAAIPRAHAKSDWLAKQTSINELNRLRAELREARRLAGSGGRAFVKPLITGLGIEGFPFVNELAGDFASAKKLRPTFYGIATRHHLMQAFEHRPDSLPPELKVHFEKFASEKGKIGPYGFNEAKVLDEAMPYVIKDVTRQMNLSSRALFVGSRALSATTFAGLRALRVAGSGPVVFATAMMDASPTGCDTIGAQAIPQTKDCKPIYELTPTNNAFLNLPTGQQQAYFANPVFGQQRCEYYKKLSETLLPKQEMQSLKCTGVASKMEVVFKQNKKTFRHVYRGATVSEFNRRYRTARASLQLTNDLRLSKVQSEDDVKMSLALQRYYGAAKYCCDHMSDPGVSESCKAVFSAGKDSTSARTSGTSRSTR